MKKLTWIIAILLALVSNQLFAENANNFKVVGLEAFASSSNNPQIFVRQGSSRIPLNNYNCASNDNSVAQIEVEIPGIKVANGKVVTLKYVSKNTVNFNSNRQIAFTRENFKLVAPLEVVSCCGASRNCTLCADTCKNCSTSEFWSPNHGCIFCY